MVTKKHIAVILVESNRPPDVVKAQLEEIMSAASRPFTAAAVNVSEVDVDSAGSIEIEAINVQVRQRPPSDQVIEMFVADVVDACVTEKVQGFVQQIDAEDAAYLEAHFKGRAARAALFAMHAHEGQARPTGEPYHRHPWRIAAVVQGACFGPSATIVALLHDVLADCPKVRVVGLDLGSAYSYRLELPQADGRFLSCNLYMFEFAALRALTQQLGESYDAYRERALNDPIGVVVKKFDIEDNLRDLPPELAWLRERYLKTLHDPRVKDV